MPKKKAPYRRPDLDSLPPAPWITSKAWEGIAPWFDSPTDREPPAYGSGLFGLVDEAIRIAITIRRDLEARPTRHEQRTTLDKLTKKLDATATALNALDELSLEELQRAAGATVSLGPNDWPLNETSFSDGYSQGPHRIELARLVLYLLRDWAASAHPVGKPGLDTTVRDELVAELVKIREARGWAVTRNPDGSDLLYLRAAVAIIEPEVEKHDIDNSLKKILRGRAR